MVFLKSGYDKHKTQVLLLTSDAPQLASSITQKVCSTTEYEITPAYASLQAAGIVGALTFGGPDHVACEQGIAQLKGSWLEVQVSASSEEKMPVNRDGEPEVSSAR